MRNDLIVKHRERVGGEKKEKGEKQNSQQLTVKSYTVSSLC